MNITVNIIYDLPRVIDLAIELLSHFNIPSTSSLTTIGFADVNFLF